MTKNEVRKNVYFDSVTLMVASSKMKALDGVRNAAVMMGTDRNRDLMTGAGLVDVNTEPFGANDTVIGVEAESERAAMAAIRFFDDYISRKKSSDATAERRVKTLPAAKSGAPESNFAVISVPGRFARAEAEKALALGLHVLMFSDNVSLEDEVALKKIAWEKGLLMMGPDCGTTIINGTALGFANVVRRGNIGLVAAAGTGLQEVTVLIDCLGGGVSQALGTGGRDLKEDVGGAMMSMCLEALKNDPETEVIVILSKPPAASVMKKILKQLETIGKPVVAAFLGGDSALLEGTDVVWASDLENAARLGVLAAKGERAELGAEDNEKLLAIASAERAKLAPNQSYLRGLYSGGTLCYETMLLLRDAGVNAWSNIAINRHYLTEGGAASRENTLLDMGEDFFTNGLPHPMIDFRQRVERMALEAADEAVGVLLLDCVCGYGTHENPAGELAPAIRSAKECAAKAGRHLSVIASVTATETDPQPRSGQIRTLEEAGAIVMNCNAAAAKLAAAILRGEGN
ncbi:MAG: acyl-CoA synthetase FdrA [Clostridia bacterium]|nr:acyl-CoA synthetase FdrA [Clostridia bacterium]